MSEVAAQRPKRPVVVWDLVLTIALLVLMTGIGFVLFFMSFFLAFAGDSCGASSVCDFDRMGTGMLVAIIGVPAIGVLALVAAILMLVLRRIAFWVPLAGIVLMAGMFALGAWITFSAVQPAAG
ncbi:hypothetical protein [Agromyces marinus]|uniref:Uncharacterized protein n=1 Tax=Agromyces marinus TaxID=1389020 RepID=A0ABN6YC94_9MICO|nr:hypothetical protein [Agromyces marinus]UIP59906.1 hypothetical protein DSM26151_28200 [Agromyces marinus]BDZ55002.1 hypothetical protein GCM10025870_20750 [Agromyces marinus]